jgi:hypothetical protein
MSPVLVSAITRADGWTSLYAEQPEFNLDLSANTDHPSLLKLDRMTP